MGMMIDEHIGVIEDLKSTMSVCMPEPEKTEICTSLGEAISTMRKYQMIQTRLDRLEHSMECLLESDPRTFTNRVCENGWLFDKIIEWRKVIREVLEDGNDSKTVNK